MKQQQQQLLLQLQLPLLLQQLRRQQPQLLQKQRLLLRQHSQQQRLEQPILLVLPSECLEDTRPCPLKIETKHPLWGQIEMERNLLFVNMRKYVLQ